METQSPIKMVFFPQVLHAHKKRLNVQGVSKLKYLPPQKMEICHFSTFLKFDLTTSNSIFSATIWPKCKITVFIRCGISSILALFLIKVLFLQELLSKTVEVFFWRHTVLNI